MHSQGFTAIHLVAYVAAQPGTVRAWRCKLCPGVWKRWAEISGPCAASADGARQPVRSPRAATMPKPPSFDKLMAAEELLSEARDMEFAAGNNATGYALNSILLTLFQVALIDDAEAWLAPLYEAATARATQGGSDA